MYVGECRCLANFGKARNWPVANEMASFLRRENSPHRADAGTHGKLFEHSSTCCSISAAPNSRHAEFRSQLCQQQSWSIDEICITHRAQTTAMFTRPNVDTSIPAYYQQQQQQQQQQQHHQQQHHQQRQQQQQKHQQRQQHQQLGQNLDQAPPRPPSPRAPAYSPITPKVQPVLPVPAATPRAFVPPDNGANFTFQVPDAQTQQPAKETPVIPPTEYIPRPPNLPFSSEDASDAIALRAAISTLQLQKKKAQGDLKTLQSLKQLALDDPAHFKTELAAGKLTEQRPT